jgi:hypothetical protein
MKKITPPHEVPLEKDGIAATFIRNKKGKVVILSTTNYYGSNTIPTKNNPIIQSMIKEAEDIFDAFTEDPRSKKQIERDRKAAQSHLF